MVDPIQSPIPQSREVATLGGGCFWCLDPVFEELDGVLDVTVGYAGGRIPNPSYNLVCTGLTGHAEVVQVTFDPNQISYREILDVFFTIHNPTTLNRQGSDVGTQYRSAIYYHTPEQKKIAETLIRDLDAEGAWEAPIITEIALFKEFYRAEEYHQEFFQKNPYQGYCQAVIVPKMDKFRQRYRSRLKKS